MLMLVFQKCLPILDASTIYPQKFCLSVKMCSVEFCSQAICFYSWIWHVMHISSHFCCFLKWSHFAFLSYRSEVKARQDVKPDIRQPPFTDYRQSSADYRQPPLDYRHPPVMDYQQPPPLDYRQPPLLDYRQHSPDTRQYPLSDYRQPQVQNADSSLQWKVLQLEERDHVLLKQLMLQEEKAPSLFLHWVTVSV